METETVRLQVTTTMSNLPWWTLGFTRSAVKIELHEVIEELLEDVTGTTLVASLPTQVSRILLKPRSFVPEKLSRLLRRQLHREVQEKLSRLLRRQLNREVPFCQYLAEKIALCRSSRGNYTLYQRPFLMSVNVRVVKEVRFILLPSLSVPLSGASMDVFQRLLEEQTLESVDLDETCSICIEKFSESECDHRNCIIQMPNCLHLFHQNCIFEWLARHNSCPLCRSVPYEDQDQD